MTTALVLILFGYVIYLDRRLGRLEKSVVDGFDPIQSEVASWLRTPAVTVSSSPPVEQEPAPAVAEPLVLHEPELGQETRGFVESREEPGESEPHETGQPGFAFEEWFGRRLPIWAGGITLAVAGFLIVKLSIDAGLLSPAVRVILGLLFGLALIAGAEVALQQEHRVRDARVRQALSGAGLASLYASILIAANAYALIPAALAMVGIAAVTGLAMILAIRFGAPSAMLGLAGGLAAPALIGSDAPNVPLLSLYLALAVGGLAALSRNQRWAWLGIGALLGGFGWGLLLLLGGALDVPGSVSLGLYILLLGVGLPALGLAGDRSQQLQLIAGILAAAQMAALVATGGFAMLNWGLFAAIALGSLWLANRDSKLAVLPPVGLAIALLLLGAWPDPTVRDFAIVLAGVALLYAPLPARRLWTERGSLLDAAQLGAIGLGAWLLPMLQFHRGEATEVSLGLLAMGLAGALALVAGLGWKAAGRRDDARFTILSVSAGLLAAAAASLLLPEWSIGVAIAAIGLALLHVGHLAEDRRLEPFAWIFAGAGLIAVFLPWAAWSGEYSTTVYVVRNALLAVVAGVFAWRGRVRGARTTAEFAAPLLVYGAIAAMLDYEWEPLVAPLLLVALALVQPRIGWSRLIAAMAACIIVILLGAVEPLVEWSRTALLSLMAEPVLATAVPDSSDALRYLLVPGLLVIAAVRIALGPLEDRERRTGLVLAGLLVAVALHSLFKKVFAIDSFDAFVLVGMAERTVWQFLLAGAAVAAFRFGARVPALALAAAAAGHWALYTLLLHNPLWFPQLVGDWPLLNLLLPSYGLALALTVAAGRLDMPAERRWIVSAAQMALILLFAFSTLRQLFHGGQLVEAGLGQAEDIGRSVLAIGLGIGFLLWGIARQDRAWRLASLGLMLAAVAKVFLFDASGLEGVTRIASFVALGFSLIGIGWLYARHLPSSARQPVPA